ncbi:MAG: glycosyltransferase family 1 protein [Smithella sp.]|jgi:glycosyltransferase involved in cell wall biosynthesis
MRIVIDMQGAQTESRFRGIGRYTVSFAQAIVRNRGEHEVMLALSGLFPDTIEPIRAAFDRFLPQENIRVWQAPGPVCEIQPGNDNRREVAELIREVFLSSLQPDVVHISSLFEGYVDDAVISIGRFDTSTPVSVILYDLIPLLNPDQYFKPNQRYGQYYLRKVEHLRRATMCLAISNFTREEGLDVLDMAGARIVSISTAIDAHFHPQTIDEATADQLRQKFGISHPFVLYTGGADERKNLPRLIEAYAALPASLRACHQLVFAGKMPAGDVARFQQIARSSGLKTDELLFTGYVTDEELVQLYNLCQLYVFPSWHEGFGLPPLEAMACGAPVVAANTASLPEVIGLDEALFDPFDIAAITHMIVNTLEDEALRTCLREHGLKKAKMFSWDETAKRAIRAWEAMPSRQDEALFDHFDIAVITHMMAKVLEDEAFRTRLREQSLKKAKMFSWDETAKQAIGTWEAMPPQQADAVDYLSRTLAYSRFVDLLAGYSHDRDESNLVTLSACLAQNANAGVERQLMLDVSELCQRDAATGVQRVVRSYLKWLLQSPPAGFRVEPVYATWEQGYRYARAYTQRFLGLDPSGVQDDPVRWQRGDIFFGLDMQHYVQLAHADFYRQLKRKGVTVKFLVYDLLPIQMADLFEDSITKALHERWLTMITATDGAICISKATADAFNAWIEKTSVTPAPTFSTSWVHIGADIESSKPSCGLPGDAGHVLETLSQRPTFLCVSTLEPRKCQQQILEAVEHLWRVGVDVNLILVGQQGWKIEALAERLRRHPELGRRLFWLQGIGDEYLEKVYAASTCLIAASSNEGFGLSLIEAARHGVPIVARDIPVFREVAGEHCYFFQGDHPQDLSEALKTWLELYQTRQYPHSAAMPWSTWQQSSEKLKRELVEQNYPRRQLLVDISELAQRDAKSGIQRVVRNILREWLLNPPEGYRVEPVYATVDQGYRYARRFTHSFLDYPDESLQDEIMEYAPGDVFFGLDLQPQVALAQRAFYRELRRMGVQVKFMVYDLLCVLMPQHFPDGAGDAFGQWLEVVAESNGALCISRAVADELRNWDKQYGPDRRRPLIIDWFHLGADVDNSNPTKGFPQDADTVLGQLRDRPSFLMVGTLEPRKGHVQVLDAFEQLWQSGQDVNLVIVGKQGWMVDELVGRLRAHPRLNKRLFWLEGITDEYLEKIYAASTCLIAASCGEGFGLPLIEAARHKLPIIARDIPVYHEVAGGYACYFKDETPTALAQAIKGWLALYIIQQHPKSNSMPWLTWRESARQLSRAILPKNNNRQSTTI